MFNLSPISLNDYCIAELSVIARPSYNPKADTQVEPNDLRVGSKVTELQEEYAGEWQVTLNVFHEPGEKTNFPYSFRIAIMGRFEFLKEPESKEEGQRLLRINGSSMLYGIAREVIRTNTGRGPWDPVMIPTISFHEPKADVKELESSEPASDIES